MTTRAEWRDWALAVEAPRYEAEQKQRQADEGRLNTHNMLRCLIGFAPMNYTEFKQAELRAMAQWNMLSQHHNQLELLGTHGLGGPLTSLLGIAGIGWR